MEEKLPQPVQSSIVDYALIAIVVIAAAGVIIWIVNSGDGDGGGTARWGG